MIEEEKEFLPWHRAPHGVTHWAPDTAKYSEAWYRKTGKVWYFCNAHLASSWVMCKAPTSYRQRQMVARNGSN